MKKIFKYLLMFLLIITLVACAEVKTQNEYIANDIYEEKIINQAENLRKQTVLLTTMIGENESTVGSAVVYNFDNKSKLYSAITTAEIVEQYKNSLSVYVYPKTTKVGVIDYTYNLKYNLGIIRFRSNTVLPLAKITNKNIVYEVQTGQTILTVGTPSNSEFTNNYRHGRVSTIENNIFYHDASNNYGELGSGVFDLEGYLVGINVNKLVNDFNDNTLVGVNQAIHIKYFAEALTKITNNNFVTKNIDDEYFQTENLEVEKQELLDYDEKVINVYNNLKKAVVEVRADGVYSSGLIYKAGSDNKYYIVTKHLHPISIVTISAQTKDNQEKTYIPLEKKYLKDNADLMVLVVRTNGEELQVYNSDTINNGTKQDLVKGQTIISISKNNNNYQINTGTLSKTDRDEHIFMHDLMINNKEIGAPLFNLQGQLLGFNLPKEQYVLSYNEQNVPEQLLAEGLGYAYNINSLSNELLNLENNQNYENIFYNSNKYESLVSYEEKIINVVQDMDDKTVIIKTDVGSGSGIIFKKEVLKNTNRYYVMTNEHVVNGSSEAYIGFSDGRSDFPASDVMSTEIFDLAVIRFETEKDLPVAKVKPIDERVGTTFKVGQTVIAIGTPVDEANTNYTTTGIMTSSLKPYNFSLRLGIPHSAAINSGNSGGPLFNLRGELIGLNVSKLIRLIKPDLSGYVYPERLGNALNINLLSERIVTIKQSEYQSFVKRPRLGVTVINADAFREQFGDDIINNTLTGVVVVDINENYDAFGKLFEYDLITKVDDIVIRNIQELSAIMATKTFGDTLKIEVNRKVEGKFVFVTETIVLK